MKLLGGKLSLEALKNDSKATLQAVGGQQICLNFRPPTSTDDFIYLASYFVVMQVHGGSCILSGFQRVHELLGDRLSKSDIIAAASP